MANLCNFGNIIGISSNGNIYLVNKKNVEVKAIQVPPIKSVLTKSENGKKEENRENNIVCLVFSKDGQYLAAATEDKRIFVWAVSSWSLLKEECLVKRPMALDFTPDSSRIIVADKNGDVYSFPVCEENPVKKQLDQKQSQCTDEEAGPEPLLGHLSMLFDLVVTDDGKFIITSDRDEKIRVSCYPNCYNIHTFCLGHTEFVSQLRLLPHWKDRLLSASGDGKIKLWSYLSGECFCTLDIRLQIQAFYQHYLEGPSDGSEKEKEESESTFISQMHVYSLSNGSALLALSLYKLPLLLFYNIQSSDRFLFLLSFETSAPLLDFLFLESGEVLAYLETTSEAAIPNPLALFKLSEDFSSVVQVKDHPILKFGQDYRNKLKGKDMWSLEANALYKHKYDNVAEYQKKKQERLNSTKSILPRKRKVSE